MRIAKLLLLLVFMCVLAEPSYAQETQENIADEYAKEMLVRGFIWGLSKEIY